MYGAHNIFQKSRCGREEGSPPVVYDYCKECEESVWAPEHYCPEKSWIVLSILSAGFFIIGLFIAMYGRGDILILGYGLIFYWSDIIHSGYEA